MDIGRALELYDHSPQRTFEKPGFVNSDQSVTGPFPSKYSIAPKGMCKKPKSRILKFPSANTSRCASSPPPVRPYGVLLS